MPAGSGGTCALRRLRRSGPAVAQQRYGQKYGQKCGQSGQKRGQHARHRDSFTPPPRLRGHWMAASGHGRWIAALGHDPGQEQLCKAPCEPVAHTPCEPVAHTPCEPVAHTPCEPVAHTPCEPVAHTPCEPVAHTPCEPVAHTPVPRALHPCPMCPYPSHVPTPVPRAHTPVLCALHDASCHGRLPWSGVVAATITVTVTGRCAGWRSKWWGPSSRDPTFENIYWSVEP
eukprot:366323-Chlamydomonas_euryale.AAC.2